MTEDIVDILRSNGYYVVEGAEETKELINRVAKTKKGKKKKK